MLAPKVITKGGLKVALTVVDLVDLVLGLTELFAIDTAVLEVKR
jgi:hypothetical protein